MKILVINCGSSSIKYQLFEMPGKKVVAKGLIEKIGEESSFFVQKGISGKIELQRQIPSHEEGLNFIVEMLIDGKDGVISSVADIHAVGHRVVHGGEGFTKSVLITEKVLEHIQEYADLAPLHNPPNLVGIKASKKFLPHAVQVAVFDTAFHQTIPPKAYFYAVPAEFYDKYKIRKYGFHGTSHRYVAQRLAVILQRDKNELNVISCHLGNGCSVTAIRHGESFDTSMGFTPLEGLVMGTRSGDIDSAIIFHLINKGYSAEALNNLLNKKSGLLGVSGLSNDMRNLMAAREKGNEKARLAIDIFCYRLRKYIGAYMAALGKTDCIIFTGGIGENNAAVRKESVSGMESLGLQIDDERNAKATKGFEGQISSESSTIKAYVIPTDEELSIALDTYEIACNRNKNQA